jgi:signal transduction histidine kinase
VDLDELIASQRERIIRRWTERVQQMATEARTLDPPTLVDHLPGVLDDMIGTFARRGSMAEGNAAVEHGKQRLRVGFDLATVVHEYAILRDCILDVIAERGRPLSVDEARGLGDAINTGIADAVVEYSAARTHIIEMFIGVLSHDLGDPLNAVSTGAQLILRHEGELPAVVVRVCRRIASSAERMSHLLGELMDFSRAGLGGGLRLRRRWIDLRDLAASVADELELSHPERRIIVEGGDPCSGSFDVDRMRQVWSHLGTHALRSGVAGAAPVFRLRATADEVILECHYQGASLGRQQLGSLFDPFVPHTGGGSGLGLYLVREIVRAHDGTIEVESSEEAGTTFRIRLPRGAS